MPPPQPLLAATFSLMIFLLTIGVPTPDRKMPPPPPTLPFLEITLSRISTSRVSTEEAPWMLIPPPFPPTQEIGELLVMVFSCINGEPKELPMPPPSHARLFLITLFVIVGEDPWILMPPPGAIP